MEEEEEERIGFEVGEELSFYSGCINISHLDIFVVVVVDKKKKELIMIIMIRRKDPIIFVVVVNFYFFSRIGLGLIP